MVWRGVGLVPVACERCGQGMLAPEPLPLCPVCGANALSAADLRSLQGAPELWVPPTVEREALEDIFRQARRPVPLPGRSSAPEQLALDARLVLWPLWLVDARARGSWAAEVGFAVEVESAREQFADGRWTTQRFVEVRDQWDNRLGTVDLPLENTAAPALRRHEELLVGLGPGWEGTTEWQDLLGGRACVLLPNLSPTEAWPLAQGAVEARLGAKIAEAAGGRNIRALRLQVGYDALHWTWLLRPAWSVSYLDDAGAPRVLWVDGVSGQVCGTIAASTRRGNWYALVLLSLALGLAALALLLGVAGILLFPLWIVAGALLFLAVFPAVGAVLAFMAPRTWNAQHQGVTCGAQEGSDTRDS
ncbi:MAG: hypothetical protein JXX28_14635 [Deltaproteobacteria bacterium]|nr:hypothetical protein [Deltaproteobacteria bacterium]